MRLLHDVYNAYLSPLLKKHAGGAVLTMEDLASSLEAAKAVLSKSPNEFVMRKALDLHNNQIRAYKEAARKSLEQWAQKFPPLPSVENGETLAAFVLRSYAMAKSTRPNWQVTDAELDDCVLKTLQSRATGAYNNFQSASKLSSPPPSPKPKFLPTQEPQQPKKATTAAGHKRALSSVSSGAGADAEDGEIDEPPENNEEIEAEMLDDANEEGEEGEEDDGEDGEVAGEGGDEESSQPGDDPLAATNGAVASTTNKPTTNGTNTKRKKQPQQQGRNTKKRVVKRKSAIQKKGPPGGGNQNASNNNGTAKKAPARKKPQGKKGRATNKPA